MNRLKIIKPTTEPQDINCLWLKDGILYQFVNGTWIVIET